MTNNEKKEWLQRYRECWAEVEITQQEIEELNSRAQKITASLSPTPGGGQRADFTLTVDRIIELKEKLEAQVTPASREETLERFGAIEQALSRLHSNPAVPVEKLQTIQSQLDDVRNKMQGQQQHIEDTKRISLEIYRNFKIMVDTLNSYKTDKEEVTPLPFYQRICNKVTSWIRPGLFILSAVLVLCSASIWLNIRLATRMQQLQDNDMKYRYLLMQGWANGEVLDILETKFNWQRDNDFIQILTDSVIDFEYRSKKQAEAISKLTTADVNAALRKYIKPDEITFVLAGDQKKAAQKKQD